jgi:hypothetical protein
MISITRILLATVAAGVLATGAHAQTLAQWNFTTNTAPTTVGSGVTASNVASAPSGGLVTFGATGGLLQVAPANGATGGNNNLAAAILSNSYFQFTVTPQSGQALSISSLSFLAGFPNNTSVTIRSNVDSFATDVGQVSNASSTLTNYSFSLSGNPAYQNRASAVTFRAYVYGANNNNQNLTQFDNLTISGVAAAIPEPGSLALLGLGATAGMAILRRRRVA